MSTKEKVDYTKWRADLQPFWESSLPDKAYFSVKPMYTKQGRGPFVRMLKSELENGDVYCEFINLDNEMYFSDRRLYKLNYNPNFSVKYKLVEGKKDIYLLDLSDFTLVENTPSKMKYPEREERILHSLREISILELTAQDLYAIIHKEPVSNKPEINDLISKNL